MKLARWGWGNPETTYPAGQILVVVPNALVHQWESEARRMMDTRYWNIIVYPPNERQRGEFWGKVWSKIPEGLTTILIVSHSVRFKSDRNQQPADLVLCFKIMRAESRLAVNPERTRLINPEEGPRVAANIAKRTIFSQKWALSIWDEAQHLRTEGSLARGAHAIRVRSGSMVLASATPLFNSERVFASIIALYYALLTLTL